MLTKDLTEPLPSAAELAALPQDGNHPLLDRDDVHEVYAEWRAVFNSYDPPRTAVAEAWVHPSRVPLYASIDSLGQAFNFDLLEADFDARQFRRIVTDNLALAARSGSSTTWVLSNHDVVRHATRYGLPDAERGADGRPTLKHGNRWLLSGGTEPALDAERGQRRARAAALFVLGLPGSAYLYQGEELGLHEVADIPDSARQDPTFFRSPGVDQGRDGCRVPLPWTAEGPAFGFGDAAAHLPQPDWFAAYAVDRQDGDPASTLSMYRRALDLRHELQTAEQLEWLDLGREDAVGFARPDGWIVVTNFGTEPIALPAGEVLLSSVPVEAGTLPGEASVWLRA
jgi:alpha-glucosidase